MTVDILQLLEALDHTSGLKEEDKELCKLYHMLTDENKKLALSLIRELAKQTRKEIVDE